MEGGIGIFLLLVLLVIAAAFGIALYVTGGAIMFSKDKQRRRPRGKTDPIAENTTAMRTPDQREPSEES